jgi:Plasma-membrane choline transporter
MQSKKTDSIKTLENEKEADYEDMVGHLHGDSEFTGPVSKRKCTNVFFLIVFFIANLGLIGASVYIFIKGDPSILSRGNDIRAEVCGTGNLADKKFMFFPNSTDTDWSLCVEACPYYYYQGYYCIYDRYDPNLYYPEWGCYDAYDTTVYGLYCVPAQQGRKIVFDYLGQTMSVIYRAIGDLYKSWDCIAIGYSFTLIVGLVYLYLMRFSKIAKFIVLFSVYILVVLTCCIVYLLYATGIRSLNQSCGDYGPVTPEYCDTSTYYFYLILAIFTGCFLGVYLYKIIKKYPNFQIGIEMIELTSKPLKVMKELAIFPILQIIIGSGILLLLIMLIGWNMGTVTASKIYSNSIPGGHSSILSYSIIEKYILAYNIFMSIWWCNFLVDLGKFVMSGGVSTWYFSRQKSVLYVRII